MLQALFSSRARVRLLTIFMMDPDARLHARALAARVGTTYSAVWKELVNLERAGVLLSESSANVKAYQVNPRCPILPELRAIILKTTGAGDVICQALTSMDGLDAAFIYGSFAAGDMDGASDIDVMLVGRVELERLAPVIARLEKDLGRAVNYVVYTQDEWRSKQQANDPFIVNVLASPKVMLIGDEDALRATPKTGAHQALPRTARGNQVAAASRRARSGHRKAQSASRS